MHLNAKIDKNKKFKYYANHNEKYENEKFEINEKTIEISRNNNLQQNFR